MELSNQNNEPKENILGRVYIIGWPLLLLINFPGGFQGGICGIAGANIVFMIVEIPEILGQGNSSVLYW